MPDWTLILTEHMENTKLETLFTEWFLDITGTNSSNCCCCDLKTVKHSCHLKFEQAQIK